MRKKYWVLLAALLGAAIFLFAQRNDEQPKTAETTSSQLHDDTTSLVAEDIFASLYPGEKTRHYLDKDEGKVVELPHQLLALPDHLLLITKNDAVMECHACNGWLNFYFVLQEGDGYTLVAKKEKAVLGAGWGKSPEDYRISQDFLSEPLLYFEGGGGGQGYFYNWASLYRLDHAATQIANIKLGYSNSGAVGSENGVDIEGVIANIKKDSSFSVIYSGSENFTETYYWRDGKFSMDGKSKMEKY